MITHCRPARRFRMAAVAAWLMLISTACTERVHKQATIEEPPRLASVVHMGDPAEAGQLVSGFYDVEGGSWRWTAREFAVKLRPPAQAARLGAVLELHFSVPQPSIDKLKSVTLNASVDGTPLGPETYRKAGDYVYRREVSPALISGDALRIDFQLDKAIAPGAVDRRELGIVAASAGLVAK